MMNLPTASSMNFLRCSSRRAAHQCSIPPIVLDGRKNNTRQGPDCSSREYLTIIGGLGFDSAQDALVVRLHRQTLFVQHLADHHDGGPRDRRSMELLTNLRQTREDERFLWPRRIDNGQ